MRVTVYVPIQMEINGEDTLEEVHEQLAVMKAIINQSELESVPTIKNDLVTESEIVEE